MNDLAGGHEFPDRKASYKFMEMRSLRARDWQGCCISFSGPRTPPSMTGLPMNMRWTPNKVTLLRVLVGFAAVSLFWRGAWANLTAVGVTVASIAPDALDRHLARTRELATPMGGPASSAGGRIVA